MAVPTFVAEVAFGNNPGDASLAYTDLSSRLRLFNYTRGRQYELNRMSAGIGSKTLLNLDRALDPTNTSGVYYPNVVPVVPTRLSGKIAGSTYPIFTSFVQRWPQQRTGPTFAEVPLDLIDGFELLANAVLPGAVYPSELTGARVARVLNAVGWSSSARSIGTGQSTLAAYTFATSDGIKALDHLLNVADDEVGLFFIGNDGRAVFIDRHTSLATTSQATFSDKSNDGGAITYTDIVATVDKDLIFNDWVGTRSGGSMQEAINSDSILRYGRRTQVRTSMLTTDPAVLQQMQYLLSQYQWPVYRIQSITIAPGSSTAAWQQVFSRDIGDRITVRSHPPGGGAPIIQDSFIQQIRLDVGRHAASGRCTWQLLPVSVLGYWFASYSQVGFDTRAGY